mmetsp:Transcript_4866/g.11388  ORF Transcript_4866/g.11388 Transcript_4866/m.11388 type:complete len:600 (+) Transcript_4866:19-1818(+)
MASGGLDDEVGDSDGSDERIQKVLEAFKKYDADGDGMINFTELGNLMRGLAGSAIEWTDEHIQALLTAMDSDHDGKVVLSDFGAWLFGTQLSADDEMKLKTAELTLAPKAKAKGKAKAKVKAKAKAKVESQPAEEEGPDDEGEDEDEEDGDEEEDEDDYDEGELDEDDFKDLSMTSRNALWQKLMPARAGSAQDAAEKMKGLPPPDPKKPEEHKHALLYLQNHAGASRDLDGEAPEGADRKKALAWLKAAMNKISDGDKSYALPVKWLIGNWRLWPDPENPSDEGFVGLKSLAIKKLDAIGVKYEKDFVDRRIGQELGFIGEDIEMKVRPRQDEHIKMPEDRLGQEEQDEEEEDQKRFQAAYIVLLLTAVHAVDHLFQAKAKEICESVGGSVRAPPPKGFMRMWAKLDTDHVKAASPKAAENIDTNRVAWIFEEPSQLRDAFIKAQEVFGAPVRVKNGYDPGFNALKDTKGYRNILANYRFKPGLTWGALAGRDASHKEASAKTLAAWDKFRKLLLETFLNMGFIDEASMDEELVEYLKCCDNARALFCSKAMRNEPVAIIVEVQYMLQSYFDMRKYTHTWYKIVRAENPEALVLDYNS